MSSNLSSSSIIKADPLSDVLALLRPTSYAFRGVDAGGEWSLAYPEGTGISCFAIHTGVCWLGGEASPEPIRLAAGDVILLVGGRPFCLGSAPGVATQDAVGVMSAAPAGGLVELGGGGACSGVGGYFEFDGPCADQIIALLPPIVHVQAEDEKASLRNAIERLMRELRQPKPGGALIASHLSQALLVEALRLHMETVAERGWLFALADRKLQLALAAIHSQPGRRWTMADLAQGAGMSRSAFAARFTEKLGEPPMTYLTRWRMMLAADRIARMGEPISRVSQDLGYLSDSAFTAAFKRVLGLPPRQYFNAQTSASAGQ